MVVYHRSSERVAVAVVWGGGDGGKVLVEPGKDDEAAAEEAAGDFGHAEKRVSPVFKFCVEVGGEKAHPQRTP